MQNIWTHVCYSFSLWIGTSILEPHTVENRGGANFRGQPCTFNILIHMNQSIAQQGEFKVISSIWKGQTGTFVGKTGY